MICFKCFIPISVQDYVCSSLPRTLSKCIKADIIKKMLHCAKKTRYLEKLHYNRINAGRFNFCFLYTYLFKCLQGLLQNPFLNNAQNHAYLIIDLF